MEALGRYPEAIFGTIVYAQTRLPTLGVALNLKNSGVLLRESSKYNSESWGKGPGMPNEPEVYQDLLRGCRSSSLEAGIRYRTRLDVGFVFVIRATEQDGCIDESFFFDDRAIVFISYEWGQFGGASAIESSVVFRNSDQDDVLYCWLALLFWTAERKCRGKGKRKEVLWNLRRSPERLFFPRRPTLILLSYIEYIFLSQEKSIANYML